MKKNAFTLIEILAAIVIMGILSTIIVTASIRKVNQVRENSYKTLINSIELSAKNYVVDNENNLDDFLNNDWINISLQTLVDNKYLNNIKNPKTNKDLPLTDIVYVTRNYDGKIEATYDIEQDNKNKLTLSGAYNIYIKENSTYNDPGILLNDNLLNSGVTITGEVNTSIVKKYQITYQYNGKTLKRNIIIYSDNTADTPTIKTVTLTINEEGGTLKNNISGSYRLGKTLSIESPTKDNCIFEGWEITSSKNDYNLKNNILTIGSENITLKAKWKKLVIGVEITNNSTIINNGGTCKPGTIYVGDSFTLVAKPIPIDADEKEVKWSSSNESVATVDANGKVSIKNTGNATITAKISSVSSTCTISSQEKEEPDKPPSEGSCYGNPKPQVLGKWCWCDYTTTHDWVCE